MKSDSMIPASNERIAFLLDEYAKGHNLPLRVNDVAALTGFAVPTLNQWRTKGGGPRFMRLGRSIRYRIDEVVKWMNRAEQFTNTTEADQSRDVPAHVA